MKGKTVLVIDDCAEVLRATARMLRQYWDVEAANTVHQALTLTLLPVADVVLTDWDMPDGGGDKILQMAKAPVVIYSGGTYTEAMSRAAGFIEKPARTEELDKILFKALMAQKSA